MNKRALEASLVLWRARYLYRLTRENTWKTAKNPTAVAKWDKLRLEAKAKIHQRLKELGREKPAPPKPGPKPPHQIVLYDSIDISQIPNAPEACAGYTGGKWSTYKSMVIRFPRAKHLSIAISASENADCLDIEKGDATIVEAPGWVKRQYARGITRPALYISLSEAMALFTELAKHGIPRRQVRLWTAHFTYKPHRCTKACGFGFTGQADSTQWTDKALGRNLDESLCAPNFFG